MTSDPCARCGRFGHLPQECDWPIDTEDLPAPPKPVEPVPDLYDGFTLQLKGST